MAKALSISILFLITQLNGQQGYGCAVPGCPMPGQVRTNIENDAQGRYVSGCECVDQSTGNGCAVPGCPMPGQVRTNRVTNAQGQYVSGCQCVDQWTAQPPQIEPQ
eukprot:369498_1